MNFKIIFFSLFIIFFISCNNDNQNENNINKQEVKKENNTDNFNKFSTISLHFSNSSIGLGLRRVNENNKDLEFINNDNRAIMFIFFTTWCIPCKAEIAHLNNLYQKYKDKIRFIGVLLEDKSDEELKEFIESNNINYEIANSDANYLFAKSIDGVSGIPYIMLYNSNGKNINNYLGAVYEEMLDIDIQKVIL